MGNVSKTRFSGHLSRLCAASTTSGSLGILISVPVSVERVLAVADLKGNP